MESDDEYLFMNDHKFDYGMLTRQLQEQERIGPREYTSLNYFVQAGNLDKAITAQLLKKRDDWDWSEVEDKPMTWTTEDFKSVALALNAEARFRAENE